jgi:cytochrome c553
MSKKMVLAVVIAVACLFFAGGIYAKVADVIKLENKGCENTKGQIEFSHKNHTEDYAKKYAKLYSNGCGECHHDDKGKPIAGLTADSKVQKCFDCHKKCGEAPKGKDAPKLEKKAKLEFIAEAYHENCTGCHRDYNKEFKPEKKAPVTCNDCHPKKS